MRMRLRKGRERAGGRLSKSPLVERLKAGAAVLAISVAGCTMDVGGLPAADGALDGRGDYAVVDINKAPDSKSDSRKVPDLGPDKSVPDIGEDSAAPDKGADQLVPDSMKPDTSTNPDSGAVCPGVKNENAYGTPAYVGTPVTVGGYNITNTGPVPGGVNVDIECGSSSASIDSGVFLAKGGAEVIVNIPADKKRIRLKNISNSSSVANMNILVETL